MAAPRSSFGPEAQNNINLTLQFADAWTGLKNEYDTFAAQGVTITDAYVQAFLPNLTAAQFIDTLAAMQEVVNYIRDTTGTNRMARLYRAKK